MIPKLQLAMVQELEIATNRRQATYFQELLQLRRLDKTCCDSGRSVNIFQRICNQKQVAIPPKQELHYTHSYLIETMKLCEMTRLIWSQLYQNIFLIFMYTCTCICLIGLRGGIWLFPSKISCFFLFFFLKLSVRSVLHCYHTSCFQGFFSTQFGHIFFHTSSMFCRVGNSPQEHYISVRSALLPLKYAFKPDDSSHEVFLLRFLLNMLVG